MKFEIIALCISLLFLMVLIGVFLAFFHFLEINLDELTHYPTQYPIPIGKVGIVDPNAPLVYSKEWYTALFNQCEKMDDYTWCS